MNLAYPVWIAGLLACGMGVALLGSTKVALTEKLGIGEDRVGGLISMFGFAMMPVVLLMGFATDLVDRKLIMISGSFLMVAAPVMLGRARSYMGALVAVLLLSAGWSSLVNVLNVLMQPAFGGDQTYAMNLGNFFFGLGAFATPLVVAFCLKRYGLAVATLGLGVLGLVCGALALGIDFKALGQGMGAAGVHPAVAARLGDLLAHRTLWLCALAMFFYGPLEATMAGWATTYLGESGMKPARAAAWLSGFWLAFMGSRLATALIVSRHPLPADGGPTAFVAILSTLVLGVWLAVVFLRSSAVAPLLVVAAGLVYGPLFPTLMGAMISSLGEHAASLGGRAVGIFFLVGAVGWTFIPMAIGALAKTGGIRRGFLVAVCAAAGLLAVALVLHFNYGILATKG
ncbi:MAG TPA: MFS transporter [Verrucomicrobiae bacterium]|nr:MFS transporter [Verrucomicrobiae bacterium]